MEQPQPSAETPVRSRLIEAIADAARNRNFTNGRMRSAVHEYAGLLRAADVPPERLIITLKEMVAASPVADMRDWFRGVLTDRIVVWGIEGYYGLTTNIDAKELPSAP